ncbi:MAG TPA: hypothetical protein VNO22_18775, partial [Planctomycetota bacterium]|nr:hypothetical protein [Planctomycetota bacterium]
MGGPFSQTDPLRFNRPFESYLYAGNAPLTRTDPWGDRWKVAPGPAAAAMVSDLEKYTGRR